MGDHYVRQQTYKRTGPMTEKMNGYVSKSQTWTDKRQLVMQVSPQKRQMQRSISDDSQKHPASPNHLKYATTRSVSASSMVSSSKPSHKYKVPSGGTPFQTMPRKFHGKIVHSNTPQWREDKKESAIKFFDIDLDKPSGYQYRPGESLTGSICTEVRKNIEIRFIELLIIGQGTANFFTSTQGTPKSLKENYIYKRTYVIGTPDAHWTSVLTPGRYISTFKFQLPRDIPSTIKYEDLPSGFKLDISYHLKARICDDVGTASLRSVSTNNNIVKVLMSKRQPFNVQRGFDINLVPHATQPVSHVEDILLSCMANMAATLSVSLDRTVFLAGDDIKIRLQASLPSPQRIKEITCSLQQHVTRLENRERITFILTEVTCKSPQGQQNGSEGKGKSNEPFSYDVSIPTQTTLLPSFLHGCKIVKVAYFLQVLIRFTPAGGKLTFTVPLAIGPCAEPIYAEKTSTRKALPVFNRPVRFPCFSAPSQQPATLALQKRSRSLQSINVITRYSNSFFSRCFLCCCARSDD